jgi:uncharacterized membrane protein YcgQ (UPF0703/DUF1980 family)
MTRHTLAFIAALAFAAIAESHAQLPTVVHASRPKPAFTMADFKAQTPQKNDGTFLMEVPQILHTANAPEVQTLIAGQAVETTGQILRDATPNADGKHLRISRTQLQCCAEHAQHCSVALQFSEKAPTFKELAWVTLVGTISYKQEDGKTVPVIIVKGIKETAAPKNPLLN